jgi:hypothetical protein
LQSFLNGYQGKNKIILTRKMFGELEQKSSIEFKKKIESGILGLLNPIFASTKLMI